MPLDESTAAALFAAGIEVRQDVPLAPFVSWRVGGPADGWIEVRTVADLVAVQRVAQDCDEPVFVLGKGSNLLVADAGIRGLVVQLTGDLADVSAVSGSPARIEVGAGMALVALLSRARKEKWPGLSCFAGIPGTVGGAVRMNAGSSLGETVTPLHSVTVVHRGGRVEEVGVDALRMSYRTTHMPDGAIVAQAMLQTSAEPFEPQHEVMVKFLKHRKATQPLDQPSCGSTFRNPPGDHAGRLIEAAGLKGFTIGGAQVSPKHANFVVNTGSATAAEIRAVIEHVQAEVARQHGVQLHREVHYAGDWGD